MKIQHFLFALAMFSTSVYGQKVDTSVADQLPERLLNRPTYKYSTTAPRTIEDQEFTSLDITTDVGDLANVLGDNIYNVDSLVVRGTIDEEDINTLWDASFNGRLSVINLENADNKWYYP